MSGDGDRGKRALFLHAERDAAQSGELRRLAVPALLLEADGWECQFVWSAEAGAAGPAALAIAPLAALDALPRLSNDAGLRLIVEVDGDPDAEAADAGAALAGLGGRITAVIARSPAASAWARRMSPTTPIWLAHDPAAHGVEVEMAAFRYAVAASPRQERPALPARFELWFAEPGDAVSDAEIEALAQAWRPRTSAVVIAPPLLVETLEQAGVEAIFAHFSTDGLDEALSRADHCVFAGPETEARLRRLARARRAGAAVSADPRLAAFEPASVGARWAEMLDAVRDRLSAPTNAGRPVQVLVFLDLVQDLDLALPVLDALRRLDGVELRVAISAWLRRRSPRVPIELGVRDLIPEIYDRGEIEEGDRPSLDGVDAVVAVVESNRSAHLRAHRLFARARELGLPTFSFQHGVENLGVNGPMLEEEKDLALISEHLFVWFPEEHTPETVQAALRPRLIHVGRPTLKRTAPSDLLGALVDFDRVAAVFENLHWNRYDGGWRRRFLTDCAEFAAADPGRAVVLKPHHGGLWSVRNKHLIPQWPSNLIVADPTDPFWEPHTAPALLQIADLVITTPSTVALDAVQAGKPVAVAAYGLDVSAYSPLPLLHDLGDWTAFAAAAGSTADARRRAAFLNRCDLRGDAAGRAAACILAVARDRAARRAVGEERRP